jgi:hypothetical protein
VNNLAVLAEVESFLGETMGTRRQCDLTPEVAQRLKEMTVSANRGTSNIHDSRCASQRSGQPSAG